MHPKIIPIFLLMGFSFVRLWAGDPKYEINVNVMVTPEGKKLRQPSKAHPAYYYPVVAGFTELGIVVGGEKEPERKEVLQVLARELAKQGYQVALPEKTPPASLLLVCRWGYMNQPTEDLPDKTLADHKNREKSMVLVSGLSANLVDPIGRVGILTQQMAAAKDDAQDDRYFIIVTAYDFRAYVDSSGKDRKMYWQARMSVRSSRIAAMEQVLPALITTSSPYFGKNTMPPQRIKVPIAIEGKVDVGPTTVMPDTPAKP